MEELDWHSPKLQRLLKFAQQAAGHRKAFSVLQNDNMLCFEHGLEFLDTIEVYDGASADAEKFLGVELCFQGIQCLPENMTFAAGVHSYVIAGRFDRVDIGGLDHYYFVVGLDGQAR